MPTIRNDSTRSYMARNTDGNLVSFPPGASIATFDPESVALAGVVKTSAAPYFNPALAVTKPVSAGPGSDAAITMQAKTDLVEIINNSAATLTVFRESLSNPPGLVVPPKSVRTITPIRFRTAALVIQFSAAALAGEVVVTEMEG